MIKIVKIPRSSRLRRGGQRRRWARGTGVSVPEGLNDVDLLDLAKLLDLLLTLDGRGDHRHLKRRA